MTDEHPQEVADEELPPEIRANEIHGENLEVLTKLKTRIAAFPPQIQMNIGIPSYDQWWIRMMLEHICGTDLADLRLSYEKEVAESLERMGENVNTIEVKIEQAKRMQQLSAPRATPPRLFQEPGRNNKRR